VSEKSILLERERRK